MKTPRGWLQLLDVAGNFLAFGFFSENRMVPVAARRLSLECFVQRALSLFPSGGSPVRYCDCHWNSFFLEWRSAKKELFQSKELFPLGRMPRHWIIPTAPAKIAIAVTLFFLSYMAIAWYIDRILIVSALMFFIACNDLNTLRWIRKHVTAYFSDPVYAPIKSERDCELIQRRREIIQEYFYSNPQYWKEAGRVAGCAIAWLVAWRGHWTSAYVVLITTLVVNEIITAKRRAHRDEQWLAAQYMGPTSSMMGKASVP